MSLQENLDYNLKNMFTIIKRLFKSAFLNFRRNFGLSMVAVFAIAITIFFMTFIFIADNLGNIIIEDIKDKITISLYFKADTTEEIIFETKDDLINLTDTRSIDYISKEVALQNFIDRHRDDPLLMAALAEVENPFLASLVIGANTEKSFDNIIRYLEDSPSSLFFEKIDHTQRKEVISDIFNIILIVQTIGIALTVTMAITSLLVVFNIIKLTIYGLKREISIMRLIGVSRRFIVSSFFFQSLITGLLGMFFGLIISLIIALSFDHRTSLGLEILPFFTINFIDLIKFNFGNLVIFQIITALFLSTFSTLIAVKKHLKN